MGDAGTHTVTWLCVPSLAAKPMLGRPKATGSHLLAAVGRQSPVEELHAHDGERIVEGEQREAEAGEVE